MPISFSGAELIEMAVQTEKGGKLYYEMVASVTADSRLRGLFCWLAEQENNHIATFEAIGRTVPVRPEELPYNWDEVVPYLKAIIDSRYFLGSGNKAIELARTASTPGEALYHALSFEKETLLFYIELQGLISVDAQPAVQRLIAEEKSHIRQLTEMMKCLPGQDTPKS